MHKYLSMCYIWLLAMSLWATELPPPFTSYETTSTAGGNGTVYEWDVSENSISGNLYAGRVMLSSLSSSAFFKFRGEPGILKFKIVNYAGGLGCLDPYWFCAWLTDDEFIDNWHGSLDGKSYKENLITCHFQKSGTHEVRFSISMQKQTSKYNVQGPRVVISDIEWLPDYVNANVDGKSVYVDGDWIRQNVSSNVIVGCKYNYGDVLDTLGNNGYTVLDSYVAGLTPTNSDSRFIADIHMINDATFIQWKPNLDSRIYTIYGKTNLTDTV